MSARTILNPPLLNELNDLFNGSGTSSITASSITATDGISIEAGGLVVSAGGSTITAGDLTLATGNITALAGDIAAAGSLTAGGLSVDTATVNGTVFTEILTASTGDITATDGNIVATNGSITAGTTITASGTITATAFAGGIAGVKTLVNFNLASGASSQTTITISDFVGVDTGYYVASQSSSSGASPIVLSVAFEGTSGGDTTVVLTIFNVSTTTQSATNYPITIICLN